LLPGFQEVQANQLDQQQSYAIGNLAVNMWRIAHFSAARPLSGSAA